MGAAFACLVPRLVTGQFDPTTQKAVWPSTGNYCRGGAYDSALLGCESVAILPEGMSQERFDWLAGIAGEVIKTPGSESNVKEIFDKCNELRDSGENLMIFNQFDEFGNYLWHYEITGRAIEALLERMMRPGDEFRGVVSATGSAGTIACGDYLKQKFPGSKIAASEALQCPTILENGFGAHRIEGIGDKHIPWIHNVKNTDLAIAIDDNAVVAVARLFNEPAGRAYLAFCPANEREAILHSLRNSPEPQDQAVQDHGWVDKLLKDARIRGYGHYEAGLGKRLNGLHRSSSIAIPVRTDGRIRACLSLVWCVDDNDWGRVMGKRLPALMAAAQEIAARLRQQEAADGL